MNPPPLTPEMTRALVEQAERGRLMPRMSRAVRWQQDMARYRDGTWLFPDVEHGPDRGQEDAA